MRGKIPTVELYIQHRTKEENKELLDKLKTHSSELEWYDNSGNKSKAIKFYMHDEYDFSEEKRDNVIKWFSETMQEFDKTLNSILQYL